MGTRLCLCPGWSLLLGPVHGGIKHVFRSPQHALVQDVCLPGLSQGRSLTYRPCFCPGVPGRDDVLSCTS